MDADEYLRKFNSQLAVMSGASRAAIGNLKQLEKSIQDQQNAVANLDKAYAGTVAKVSSAKKAYDAAQVQVAVQKAGPFNAEGMAAAMAGVANAAESLKSAKGEAAAAAAALGKGHDELGKLSAIVPRYSAQVDQAGAKSEAFGSRLQAALASAPGWATKLAAVITGVVLAVTAATAAVIQFVVATADAARSARLLNDAAAGSAKGGAELTAVVAELAGRIPLAKGEIAEMGRSLEIAHLSGRRMQNALEAMGITASAVGPQAAAKLEEIAARAQKFRRFWVGLFELEGTGLVLSDVAKALASQLGVATETARQMILRGQVSVDKGLEAMAQATRDKFGKTVAAQMLALDTQLAKLRENLKAMFGGLNLEPLLAGLKMITSLFDQSTVTGQTLKLMFEKLFNPLLSQASVIFPAIRAFLQGIIIGILLVEIVVLKAKKALVEAFGGGKSSIDAVKVALYGGIALVVGLTVAMSLLAFAAVVVGTALLFAFLPALATMFVVAAAVYLIVRAVQAASKAIGSVDLASAASNMVNSFVNGIKDKVADVVSAMMGMGNAAATALKSALGIASPSKVALEAAHNVTSTFSATVEDGTGDTQAAFNGMVGKGGGSGRAAASVSMPGEVHFHYDGRREDFPDFEERASEWWRNELQRLRGEGPIGAT